MIRRDMTYIGLFGYIDTTGQVRNLGIENGVADYTENSDAINYIGLLAGESEGTIIAVHTSGIADGGDGNDWVGGLVGFNNRGTITACYATGMADGGEGERDDVGVLVGGNDGTITACHATGMADGGEGDTNSVGGLVGWNDGTIMASYGFGTVTGEEIAGVNRSDDASDAPTVDSPSALTMANSSTDEANRWPARVWDFGTDSQVPVLKWITGYKSNGATEAERYPCDEALLPAGRRCGDIIPGQVR